ncbi:MAG TPA: hypothetical protein VGM86_33490 [Thermoanaerobaculia bacterium]|jgi:hypothetical protein
MQMTINFGLIIAYFLPGVLVTYSLRYLSFRIDHLLKVVEEGQAFIGPAAILIMGALVAGLIISSVRVVLVEPLIHFTGVPKPRTDYKKLAPAEQWAVYSQIVENIYRFYQFYGNIFLGLLMLGLIRYLIAGVPIFSSVQSASLFALTTGSVVTLFFAARQSMKQLCSALDDLCK